ASAVSEAGGLGIISAINNDIDWLKGQIRKTKQLTDKPFGVNIMLMHPLANEVAQIVIEEGVKVVTTGAGNPAKYMKDWLDAGIVVIPVVPSTAIAKMVERCGAAAVIAEGGESGGHVGDLTTMALIPQVCDAVNIPVIAAGGIADGRGVAAAFMLGAQGVQLGTRFLVAKECNVSRAYKEKVLNAKDIDTIVTGKRLGHPVRCLKTPFSREFFSKEYDSSVSNEELEAYGTGALRAAALDGDTAKGCFMCGQSAALVKKEQTAAEIIEEIFAEAENTLKQGIKCIK
ncbi:MAG: nitronate monooxygenase, partial [Clostridia bacterium]|nr:nitronate monooxygenase [Clostridia bacterium]